MIKMKQITIEDIRSWNPRYDPTEHLSEDWKGTALDILRNDEIPFADQLWCVFRPAIISERTMRLFAVWCYRQTLKFIPHPDPRSVAAADVAERFAHGEASAAELAVVAKAAWEAAGEEAEKAVKEVSEAEWSMEQAVSARSWAKAWAAQSAAHLGESARSAAKSARFAAEETRAAATWAASTSGTSWGSAMAAVCSAQRDKLIEMLEAESNAKKD